MLAPAVDRLPEVVNGVWLALVLIATALAIGIAVLRYRLYDIDTILNRARAYFPVTVRLALIYVGSVVGMQAVLRAITGPGIHARGRDLNVRHIGPVRPTAPQGASVRGSALLPQEVRCWKDSGSVLSPVA
jgi:hypothetical protein